MSRCLCIFVWALAAVAQTPRPSDWVSAGGDPGRGGIGKDDGQFTKGSVKGFRVVLQRKLSRSGETLNAPVVIGRLISHKGFKELAIVTSVSGHVWAIDVDLDLIFWERQLPPGTVPSCGLTAMPAMMPAPETGPGRNALRPVFIVASDGKLYRLNPANGEDAAYPLPFLPANANASDLAVENDVVRTSTRGDCGVPEAGWTIDVNSGAVNRVPYSAESFRPVTRVSANGVVFTLSGGALVARDGETGNELYSSGMQLTSKPSGTGLSIANGRVYLTTDDGTLWAFGLPMER